MLKPTGQQTRRVVGGRFAIVASEYNREYVDGMLRAVRSVLRAGGAAKVELHRVPGSFEIPVVAAVLARRTHARPEAVICLGLIWQGETTHAQHIGEAVSLALMDVAIETGVPIIHQVLSVATKAQAIARCRSKTTNRGTEAGHTALAMAAAMRAAADGENVR
jgi:6,7-dimethyl-8-ribityllumazine synthase